MKWKGEGGGFNRILHCFRKRTTSWWVFSKTSANISYLWSSFCMKSTIWGQNDKSDPDLFPMAAIGSTKCTYTPTNQWNGCRNMLSKHYWRKNKFIFPFLYSTHHFPLYSLVGWTFQDTERPPINPPLHGGKWWWWKRLWTLPPISCGSLGWYKPMWTMCNLEWFEIGQPPSPLCIPSLCGWHRCYCANNLCTFGY